MAAVIKMWHDKGFSDLFKNMIRKVIFDMANYTTMCIFNSVNI